MRTIRRIYFYLIAIISAETLIWGITNLLRSISDNNPGDQSNILSTGLAQILVSIPIFLIHWLVVQKDARESEEEKSSVVRATFLYGIMLAVLIPVIQNIMALVNRLINQGAQIELTRALIGGAQTPVDNIIAILVNLVFAVYFLRVLGNDWHSSTDTLNLKTILRTYQYLWMLYGLGLMVIGTQMLINFILLQQDTHLGTDNGQFTNSITLLLAGVPLWVYWWRNIQSSIHDNSERQSILRIVIMYMITLSAAVVFTIYFGFILYWLLRPILGEVFSAQELLKELRLPISFALPFGVLWWYFGQKFDADINAENEFARQTALRRIYRYFLSFIGLSALLYGLTGISSYIINALSRFDINWIDNHQTLAANLAILLVGFGQWLSHWLPILRETKKSNIEDGSALLSVTRKIYLYLVVFITIIGSMAASGFMIYELLQGLFGDTSEDVLINTLQNFRLVVIFTAFLIYHIQSIRRDTRQQTLDSRAKYASFSCLAVIDPDLELGKEIQVAFHRHASGIKLQFYDPKGTTDEQLLKANALILPGNAFIDPTNLIRGKIEDYQGKILLLPERSDHLIWINSHLKVGETGKACALAARALADGQEVKPFNSTSPWLIFVYIIGGLLALQILGTIISVFSFGL